MNESETKKAELSIVSDGWDYHVIGTLGPIQKFLV